MRLERLCNWHMVKQPVSGRAGIQTCACPNTVVSTSNCFWQENNRLKLHCGKCFAFLKKKIFFLFNIFKFKIQKEINIFLWLPGKTINTSEKAVIGNPAGTGIDCCTLAILVTHCQHQEPGGGFWGPGTQGGHSWNERWWKGPRAGNRVLGSCCF